MKILHLIPALSKGGAERVVVDLANHAAEAGHEVAVVAGVKVDETLRRNDLHPQVEVRYTSDANSRLGKFGAALGWLLRNWRWVASHDVVHCHLTWAAAMGSLIRLRRKVSRTARPLLVETYHAVGMPIPALHQRLHAVLAAQRDALVLMAKDPFWSAFSDRRPDKLTALIPNGIKIHDPEPLTPGERAARRREYGIPDSAKRVVGTIGRLEPERRPADYPAVFAPIARQLGPDVHFLIGGDGSARKAVEAAVANQGLADRVHLPGLIRNPLDCLPTIDLYVTVNVGPITGVAALEAIGAGIPVIAIQLLDAYRAQDDDLIWSSPDLGAVADRAIALLESPDALAELKTRQRATLVRTRTVESMADAYYAVYRDAAARAGIALS